MTQDLTAAQTKLLDKAFRREDRALFLSTLSTMTAHQAARYCAATTNDFSYWLWSECVTWGFEVSWASTLLMTPEALAQAKIEVPGYDFEVPENFDPHIPLGKIAKWAPQDHTRTSR